MRPPVLAAAALLLFLFWSNSFIAIGYLLGSEGAAARFDPLALTVARYIPVFPISLLICLRRPRESWATLRRFPVRFAVCGMLAVPAYNLALYSGQARGVPAPIASLTTALVPLFVMLLAVLFLGEKLTARPVAAFAVSLAGMLLIALAKRDGAAQGGYGLSLGLVALAPLSWSIVTIVAKPLVGRVPPFLLTNLYLVVGSLPLVLVAPFSGGPQVMALDAAGWAALLFLSILCTVLGFALWTWLLKYLPASTVGLTVFLNPPLTTLSKVLLATFLPATFFFTIRPLEWLGGAIVLIGVAIALGRRRRAA